MRRACPLALLGFCVPAMKCGQESWPVCLTVGGAGRMHFGNRGASANRRSGGGQNSRVWRGDGGEEEQAGLPGPSFREGPGCPGARCAGQMGPILNPHRARHLQAM